jgi:putative N6-adenine-specific DNA methylase
MQKDLSSFAKRIRRQVTSRDSTFLAVSQAALQPLCGGELEENGFSVLGITDGGVEFAGSLREGWRANLALRIPSRVYCRITRFRAGAREELFRRVAGFPWELWLPPETGIRLEVRVRLSRLRHEGAAAEAFFDGVRRHYEELHLSPPREFSPGGESGCQRALMRVIDNTCEVSLDMSGMPLYSRGYRTGGGKAPVRESLAAALLREMGWKGEGIFADAMTGSGTFAIEAALIAAGIPPGANRSFQFQAWPSFSQAPWDYIKKKACDPAAAFGSGEKKRFLLASDTSGEALTLAKRNAARAGISENILWETRDFFAWTGEKIRTLSGAEKDAPAYLVLNPPYGKRLEGGGETFYRELGRHIQKNFRGWKVLVLFPGSAELKAFSLQPARLLRPRHGGIVISAGFW